MILIPQKFKNTNVFVYSGGKTGSTTLHTTFEKQGFKSIHVHSNAHFQKFLLDSNTFTLHQLIHAAASIHNKVYIFDIYRNPIERNLSSFFHNLIQHLPKHDEKYSIPKLINYYNTNKKYLIENYYPILDLLQEFNLELPTTFDFEKEYTILNHKNISIILLRFSSIDKWGTLLSEIFEKPIEIVNDNLTEGKWYAEFYKKFTKTYRPPLELVEQVKEHTLFKFFNTKEEQETYLQKWWDLNSE